MAKKNDKAADEKFNVDREPDVKEKPQLPIIDLSAPTPRLPARIRVNQLMCDRFLGTMTNHTVCKMDIGGHNVLLHILIGKENSRRYNVRRNLDVNCEIWFEPDPDPGAPAPRFAKKPETR